jgi:CRISPR/Cas system-associated endoribonuclease Cas2
MGDIDSFITDKQFIMHVMNNLNKHYGNMAANLEKLINDKTNPLTIEQMREDLSLKHERLYGTDDADESDNDG